MKALTISELKKFCRVQMAAESLFGYDARENPELIPGSIAENSKLTVYSLSKGNGHASKFTQTDATKFVSEWTLVEHVSNTKSGFSGTLFQRVKLDSDGSGTLGEYVLSCRSTEFIDDAARDCQATNNLELKETGWAFGQIDDLESWYQTSLKSKIDGAKLNVTGYSLGGHLATAFNLMHKNELNGGQVVTFNGAGVGRINGSDISDSSQLIKMINTFNTYRNNEEDKTSLLFLSKKGKALYSEVKSFLNTKRGTTGDVQASDLSYYIAKVTITGEHGGVLLSVDEINDFVLLKNALERISSIVSENDRVHGLNSGGKVDTKPAFVHDGQIGAEDLDYQLAVLKTSEQFDTSSYIIPNALGSIFVAKYIAPNPLDNQVDVVGTEMDGAIAASMVANSQVHYGQDTKVFIEDQPGYRGSAVALAAWESAINSGVKLLLPEYSVNDFGDTHSLVLIVDSLTTQDLLCKLSPSLTAESCANLLQIVSNKKADTNSNGLEQGICEGDVLENMVSYVAKITGCNIEKMNPSCDGNTWSEINSRELLHKNIEKLNTSLKNLMGKVKISVVDGDTVASVKNNFGALLSLVNASPIVLSGVDAAGQSLLNTQLGGKFKDLYTQWQADAKSTQAEKKYFSDSYLQDREKFISWIIAANEQNNGDAFDGSAAINIDSPGLNRQFIYRDVSAGRNVTFFVGSDKTQPAEVHEVSFGSSANDTTTLSGERQYGGDGDDTLIGSLKSFYPEVYLEGGSGVDTYKLISGGLATVLDCDGKGIIQVDGQVVKGAFLGLVQDDGVYYSQDNPYKYRLSKEGASDWALAIRDSATSLHYTTVAKLQAWQSGEFGISTQQTSQARFALEFPNASAFIAIDANQAPESGVQLVGSPNVDSIKGSWYSDIIKTGEGNSFVMGNGGSDYIEGGSGNDYIVAGPGIDPTSTPDSDVVYAGAGTDIVIGGGGDDVLCGDKNDGGYLNDTAESSSKGDWLSAGRGDDLVYGSSGQDVLLGGADGDTIQGGAGNDLIMGDASGSSQLAIGTVSSFSQAPVIIPGMGGLPGGVIQPSAPTGLLSYVWESGAFALANSASSPLIVAKGSMFEWQWSVADDGVLNIANQSTVLYSRVDTNAGDDVLDGGNGNDWVAGQAGNDTLYGGEGDDILYGDDAIALTWGVEGNDKIHAGAGKDKLFGGGGNDILWATEDDKVVDIIQGGEGNDSLFGGSGADQLDGGAGDDDLHAGNDGSSLVGGAGADLLIGGLGNDKLDGGAGSDYFITSTGADSLIDTEGNDYYQINSKDFVAASGKTVISDSDGKGLLHLDNNVIESKALTATSKTTWKANSGAYTLELKAGSLFISMKDAAGSVEIKNFVNSKDGYLGLVLPEYSEQPDPQVNHAPVLAAPLPDKTAKEDKAFKFVLPVGTFTDSDSGDSLSLSATLSNGKALPTWLKFDAKTRTFSGTPDNDQVGAIAIRVTATDKAGAKASDVFKVTVQNINDAPEVATALPEKQDAKEGALFKYVAPLNEVFKDVDKGDVLTYSSTLADGSALPAWLQFDAATGTFSGTPVTGSAGLLGLVVTATDKAGASVSNGFSLNIVGTINVLKGTSDNDTLKGSEGQDKIYGYDGDDTLYGRGGDDALSGSNGNDRLDGGAGNDDLFGGAGNDTYFFGKGYGQDLISDTDATFYNLDRLLFKSGIATDQLWFKNSNNNLEVSIIGTSDTVTIKNWFTNSNAHIEQLKTADGKTLLDTQVANLVNAMATLTPPAAGETSLSTAYHNKLDVVIAANWK